MKKVVKRALSCILVLNMILALIPSVPLSAWAENSSSGQNERPKNFSDMIYDEFIIK